MSLTATPQMVNQTKKRKISGGWETLRALPWLLPTLILILGVVLYPAGLMIYTSFFKYNRFGIGGTENVGLDNYFGPAGALTFPGVPISRILLNTVVWVVIVVIVTVILSLALAQFLNKPFRGRKFIRLFIILPWACSVVMTATVFRYGLEQNVGLFNRLMVDTGILESAKAWTKDPTSAFWVAVFVAIYVSLPFTTYTILAGLQAERVGADEGAGLGIVVAEPVVVEATLVVGGLSLEATRRGGRSRIVGGELAEGASLEGVRHAPLAVDQRLREAVVRADLEEPSSAASPS